MSTISHSEPAPTLEEVWRLFRENAEQQKETARQMKETDIKLNKLEKLFTSQWGKLVESLVEGALIKIFNQRGIPVQHTYTRAKGNHQGRSWEVDIVAKNGDAVIIVEVKTTLRPDDVKNFIDKLPHIKTWMREDGVFKRRGGRGKDGTKQRLVCYQGNRRQCLSGKSGGFCGADLLNSRKHQGTPNLPNLK